MDEWRDVFLRDICESIDYGLTASATDEVTGTRFLRITDIVGGVFDWSRVPYVDTTSAKIQKYRLHHGDIVIARTGATTGRSKWVDEPPESVFASYLVRLKAVPEVDSRFVGYLLRSNKFLDYVSGVIGGKSAQPNASAATLTAAPLTIPTSRTKQESISMVLGALDDKIAVNERIASTARSVGCHTFLESVQQDFTKHELSSVTSVLVRGSTPRYSEDPNDIRVINQRCIRDGRVGLDAARRSTSAPKSSDRILRKGDVLVNSTGVGTLGRVARWSGDDKCTVDTHVTIVRFDNDAVDPVCASFAMLTSQRELEELGEGSTGQTELSRKKLGEFSISLPSFDVCQRMRPELDALEDRADAALNESATLAQLRDALLPKLMSGEIRVRDAEKAVEEAT